jgi:hypothetical protein
MIKGLPVAGGQPVSGPAHRGKLQRELCDRFLMFIAIRFIAGLPERKNTDKLLMNLAPVQSIWSESKKL